MRRLRKYFALSPSGRAIVLRSLMLLPMVTALLRVRGMAHTTVFLGRLGGRAEHDHGTLAPREVARLVNAAASVLRAHCLSRSLVLSHLLRNRGILTEIRLGVSKLSEEGLSAHAWVELNGLPINDGVDVSERYAALPSSAAKFRAPRP